MCLLSLRKSRLVAKMALSIKFAVLKNDCHFTVTIPRPFSSRVWRLCQQKIRKACEMERNTNRRISTTGEFSVELGKSFRFSGFSEKAKC